MFDNTPICSQNPLKAGLADDIALYQWSSCKEYIFKNTIVNINFALSLFDQDLEKAIEKFKKFKREEKK